MDSEEKLKFCLFLVAIVLSGALSILKLLGYITLSWKVVLIPLIFVIFAL